MLYKFAHRFFFLGVTYQRTGMHVQIHKNRPKNVEAICHTPVSEASYFPMGSAELTSPASNMEATQFHKYFAYGLNLMYLWVRRNIVEMRRTSTY